MRKRMNFYFYVAVTDVVDGDWPKLLKLKLTICRMAARKKVGKYIQVVKKKSLHK